MATFTIPVAFHVEADDERQAAKRLVAELDGAALVENPATGLQRGYIESWWLPNHNWADGSDEDEGLVWKKPGTRLWFVEWRTEDWDNPTLSFHVEMTTAQAAEVLALIEERLPDSDPVVVPAEQTGDFDFFIASLKNEWLPDEEEDEE